MSQQREDTPSPAVFRADALTVLTARAEHADWLCGVRETGRRLLPDRDPRTAGHIPAPPLVSGRDLVRRLAAESLLIAMTGDRVAGSCWLRWQSAGPWRFLPARAGYVTELVVTHGPAARAVTSLLLSAAVRYSVQRERPLLRLTCGAANHALRGYLDTAGFRQLGIHTPAGGRPPQILLERGRPTT